jgi:hypothetical protein
MHTFILKCILKCSLFLDRARDNRAGDSYKELWALAVAGLAVALAGTPAYPIPPAHVKWHMARI